jgi:OOP family OmpA-OmpF porin
MKLFTLISLMLIGFAQLIMAQDTVQTSRLNSMSNVVGITIEGGSTFGMTDYNISRMAYTVRGDLAYYLPSTGDGNLGARFFGQTGFVSGRGAPLAANNPTNVFSTRIDILGGALTYLISIDNDVYLWASAGASNIWYYPYDGNNNRLPNAPGMNDNFELALNGDAGVKVMVTKHISIDLSAGVVFGKKDYLDDVKSGSNNDSFFDGLIGASYYIGRPENLRRDLPSGIHGVTKVFIHDTVVVSQAAPQIITQHDTVVVKQPSEIESVVLNGDANFEFNKSNLLPNAYVVLDSLINTMKAHTDYKWEVGGYTDAIGSDNYNIKLSQKRAQSVVDYLVSKGVEANNLKIVAYGKGHPIATNETLEGRSMNRRVEIKILVKGNQ